MASAWRRWSRSGKPTRTASQLKARPGARAGASVTRDGSADRVEWLQREERLVGAFEAAHDRPKERPNGVRIVHPKTGEEAWWPLNDERGEPLFPELMAKLDAINSRTLSGPMIRRDRKDRKAGVPLPWITAQRRTQLSEGDRQGDRPSRQVARRSLFCLVSPRWIYRGSGRRSDRRAIARGRALSVSEAAPDLRQTHT